MPIEIKMPLAAEGLETATILEVKVTEGDTVASGQTLLEIEAEKSTVDLPAPGPGRISKVLVKKGDQIKVGQTLFLFEEGGADLQPPQQAAGGKTALTLQGDQETRRPGDQETRSPDALGWRRDQETRKGEEFPAGMTSATTKSVQPQQEEAEPQHFSSAPSTPERSGKIPLAGPATRRLARELGVNLELVTGSGRNGRITEEDVKAFVRQTGAGVVSEVVAEGVSVPPLPDFTRWGEIERQPLSQVRRLTAQQMSLAWRLVPHVTQHDLADVTDLEAFRRQQKGEPKITVTAFALKAAAISLKEFPQVNSSLDQAAGQLVLKHYCHIGVAVDTERGLLVPVIRDVDKKSVHQLAQELTEVADRARQGQADMQGGTFTITNLGGIGGTAFTPIVNYPEVAILGLSRSRWEPVVRGDQMVPRLMLPLSLSYDHRVVDGALGARFLRRIAAMLENPLVMLLHA